MAIVGYVRVSTIGQNLDVQLEKLREYGCEEIFEEKRAGRRAQGVPAVRPPRRRPGAHLPRPPVVFHNEYRPLRATRNRIRI